MKINFLSFKHFFTLSFGSLISLFINTLILVVFSRIYSKEHFGDYAIFICVVSLMSIMATFRIEHLIVLEKTIIEAACLSNICKKVIKIFSFFSFFLSLILCFFGIPFFSQPPFIWLLVPISIYSLSHIIIFLSWNNRIKNYKLISTYKIVQSASVGVIGVLFSFFLKDYGLIIAYITGLFFSFLLFNINYKNVIRKFNLGYTSFKDVRRTFTDNKKYIKSSFGLEFFNTISKYIPNFILNAYYGNGIVGVYDMTLKVLNIPKNIISLNIGELYYQKASVFYHKSKEKFSKMTIQTFYTLFLIGVICYLPFIFWGKELFVFVLGDKWRLSGEFSEVIAFWFLLLFVSSPMAYIFYIKQTLKVLFWFIFISFIVKSIILWCLVLQKNEIDTIYYYTLICVALDFFLCIIILKQNRYKSRIK
jgi:O-antigen/teichoic acid export membrane protein